MNPIENRIQIKQMGVTLLYIELKGYYQGIVNKNHMSETF